MESKGIDAIAPRGVTNSVARNAFFSDSVGAALLQAFVDTLGQRFTPAVRAPWTQASSIVTISALRAARVSGRLA